MVLWGCRVVGRNIVSSTQLAWGSRVSGVGLRVWGLVRGFSLLGLSGLCFGVAGLLDSSFSGSGP